MRFRYLCIADGRAGNGGLASRLGLVTLTWRSFLTLRTATQVRIESQPTNGVDHSLYGHPSGWATGGQFLAYPKNVPRLNLGRPNGGA